MCLSNNSNIAAADNASADNASARQQTRINLLEREVTMVGRSAGLRKRELLQDLLGRSKKWEDPAKVEFLLDLVAELIPKRPKIETVSLPNLRILLHMRYNKLTCLDCRRRHEYQPSR
jgi:hypothetical protein